MLIRYRTAMGKSNAVRPVVSTSSDCARDSDFGEERYSKSYFRDLTFGFCRKLMWTQ
jgi:hypothetical protein